MNLHPPCSSFPPALIVLGTALELLNLHLKRDNIAAAVKIILWAALLGVIAAFFTGYQASELADQHFKIANKLIDSHHDTGRLLLMIFPFCLAMREIAVRARHARGMFAGLYWVLLLVCLGLVGYTGYLGGELVFKHGAGVYAVDAPFSATPPAP